MPSPAVTTFGLAIAILTAACVSPAAAETSRTLSATLEGAKPVLAPFQHVRFCLTFPSECIGNEKPARVELTEGLMSTIREVNHRINHSIAPLMKNYGASVNERWSLMPSAGDCNDYAVSKRYALVAAGIPAGALRLAVVRTRSDEGHLVLVVSTSRGDLVLDNLTTAVTSWDMTRYRWLKIQSAVDPKLWADVAGASKQASR